MAKRKKGSGTFATKFFGPTTGGRGRGPNTGGAASQAGFMGGRKKKKASIYGEVRRKK